MRGLKSTSCYRNKSQSGNITVRLLHYLETQKRHASHDSHRFRYRTDSSQPLRAEPNASHRFRARTDSSQHFRAGLNNGHKLRGCTGPSQPFRTCPNDEPTGGQDFYANRSEGPHESQKLLARPLMQANKLLYRSQYCCCRTHRQCAIAWLQDQHLLLLQPIFQAS